MAEVHPSTVAQSGDLAQRFIEFVMMQQRQISLLLGLIPHPQTGRAEVHLDAARLFLDQLSMIREKTRGNLSAQETEILDRILADLQRAFVAAKGEAGGL